MQAEYVEPTARRIIEHDASPRRKTKRAIIDVIDTDFVLRKKGSGVFQRNVSRYMKKYDVDKDFAEERVKELMEEEDDDDKWLFDILL